MLALRAIGVGGEQGKKERGRRLGKEREGGERKRREGEEGEGERERVSC